MKKRGIYFYIYALTVLDVTLTTIGLRKGIIQEANPIMRFFMRFSLPLAIAGALSVVAAALYLMYKLRDRVLWIKTALFGIAGMKIWICILHMKWIILYINTL